MSSPSNKGKQGNDKYNAAKSNTDNCNQVATNVIQSVPKSPARRKQDAIIQQQQQVANTGGKLNSAAPDCNINSAGAASNNGRSVTNKEETAVAKRKHDDITNKEEAAVTKEKNEAEKQILTKKIQGDKPTQLHIEEGIVTDAVDPGGTSDGAALKSKDDDQQEFVSREENNIHTKQTTVVPKETVPVEQSQLQNLKSSKQQELMPNLQYKQDVIVTDEQKIH
ncbi:hypothetical protein A4A49_45308, partial [Nicotiana attenuata]